MEQIPQPQLESMRLQNLLQNQIRFETVKNLQVVIQNIANSFQKACIAKDKEERIILIKEIENAENYISEKYRDTPEERAYVAAIRDALTFLRTL